MFAGRSTEQHNLVFAARPTEQHNLMFAGRSTEQHNLKFQVFCFQKAVPGWSLTQSSQVVEGAAHQNIFILDI